MKRISRFIAAALAVIMLLPLYTAAADTWKEKVDGEIETAELDRSNSYENYIENHKEQPNGTDDIIIRGDSFFYRSSAEALTTSKDFKKRDGVLIWGSSPEYAEYKFSVSQSGMYEMKISYFPLKQSQRALEAAVKIDGEFPFSEAASLQLKSSYKSEEPIKQDERGYDYNSPQREIEKWYDDAVKDSGGLTDDPFRFYLSAGEHTLTFYLMQETFALSTITFSPSPEYISYDEYASAHKEDNSKFTCNKKYEAEAFSEKSDSSIIPQNSNNSLQNSPFSFTKKKLNIISGSNWSTAGQWIEWEIEAPETGWYSLSFRYSQSYNKNMPAHRRMYIDGTVPFKEADCFEVPFSDDWSIFSMTDSSGKEMYFWLEKGEHTVRLEAVMGEMHGIVSSLENVVYSLSGIYQKINMIVGSQPDQYRDYNLKDNIPTMIDTFNSCSEQLKKTKKQLKSISGGKGTTAGILDVLAYQLDDMSASPSSVPMRMSTLNSNISSLSSAAEELKSQAMDIDYIILADTSAEKPRANDSFIQAVKRSVLTFVSSFTSDYDTYTVKDSDKSVTVWMTSGRDQAQVISRMIEDMFVPEYGIDVELKLVDANLIQAFLSGNPPDAMIMMARGQPVNLAIRGALADLSKMEDFSSVSSEFQKSALVPYCFNGGCYGLPDSQSFFMMFYRKDILKELNIEVPKTWDELYNVMQILQVNNLDVGLPYAGIDATTAVDAGLSSTSIFSALLLQNGGSFYEKDGKKTALTTPQATEAFKQWTDFYTEYDLDLTYSFYNRFRTGVMPIGIASYITYDQIYVAAPEIRNLWTMTTIPGTKKADGSIDISQGGAGTASVITGTSKHKAEAWQFLKWWTGKEAQTRYCADIESTLGPAARYQTANTEAFKNIQWSRTESEALSKQWAAVREIEEVPGSYYTVRDVDNAFRSVVLNGKNAKESLVQYSRDIDAEISRKRGEFRLDEQ